MSVDRCICCGEIVTEGRQVCLKCEKMAESEAEKAITKFEDDAKRYFKSQVNFYAYLADLNDSKGNAQAAEVYRDKMNYMIYALNRVGAMPVEEEEE